MSRFVLPFQSVFDLNGKPLDGAKLYFFESDGVTPKDTWTDEALTVANANPVIANNYGQFDDIFLEAGDYVVRLDDKNDVTQPNYPADPVNDPGITLRADLLSTASGKGSELVGHKSASTGAVAQTVFGMLEYDDRDLREFLPDSFVTDGSVDYATEIQAAIDAVGSGGRLRVDGGSFQFTALTISNDITISGNGILTGPAVNGAKPTASALIATNKTGRLSLLETYYTGEITLGADVVINGNPNLSKCLIKGTARTLTIQGRMTLNDVSFHDVSQISRASGFIDSSSGLITTDSVSDGIKCMIGGKAYIPSCISIYHGGRGVHIQFGGDVWANSSVIRYNTQEGVFINSSGVFYGDSANISDNTLAGTLINYAGTVSIASATVDSNGGAGIVSESNGATYAVNAVVTNNALVGIDCSYDGLVQATGATITGNGGNAVRIRTGGVVNILTATVDRTNNGGIKPIFWVQGRGVIYSEDNTGTGKTALNTDDYSPLYNELMGIAWIGDWSIPEDTAHRANYFALTPDNSADTIAAGVIDFTAGWMSVDTEASASTDDLDTINGGDNLERIILTAANSARTVVVKHGTGNIYLDGGVDFSLDHNYDTIELIFQWGVWVELSRSTNS